MEKLFSLIIFLLLLQKSFLTKDLTVTRSAKESNITNDPWRIHCHHCTGDLQSECAYYLTNNSSSIECPSVNDDDDFRKCYVSIVNGTVHRGCITDNFCYQHTCTICKHNDCNSWAVARGKCIQCNSFAESEMFHPKCKDKPEELPPTDCVSMKYANFKYKGCYSRIIDETIKKKTLLSTQTYDEEKVSYIERNCLYFFRAYGDSRCYDSNDSSCIQCMEDGCNIHSPNSSGKLFSNVFIILLSFFLCAKNHNNFKILLIVISILKLLHVCSALSCIKCDSSQHESCHFLQTINSSKKCVGRLPEGIVEDQCFIIFNEFALVTIRGCLSENPYLVDICENEKRNCTTCLEDHCNINQIMRERCAICDTATDPKCATTPHFFVQMCPFVHEYENGGCYFHKRRDGGIQRGCIGAGAMEFIENCPAGEECKICKGNSCNTEVNIEESSERLWCHQCQGSLTSDCAYYQPGIKSTPCSGELEVGRREQCYVGFDINPYNQEFNIFRGCTGGKFCNIHECLICNNRHCNHHNRFEERLVPCIQCSSNTDDGDYREECMDKPKEILPRDCKQDDYFAAQDSGCYSIRLEKIVDGRITSFIRRGCKYSMEPDSRCYDDADPSCVLCEGFACNIHNVNMGTILYSTGSLYILGLFKLLVIVIKNIQEC